MRVLELVRIPGFSKTLYFLSMLYVFAFSGPLTILRLASLFVCRGYLSGQDTLCDSLFTCGLVSFLGNCRTAIICLMFFVSFLLAGVV
jgi:hypothetical protein